MKEISLGLVLLRLFQTSRRFHVEIQPQLVLLQKTLLNVEGLGRQLDPDLDLWATAKPFLEQWMLKQVGPQRLWSELKAQAPHYAKLLPELPLLLHGFLKGAGSDPQTKDLLARLLAEQQKTNRVLRAVIYTVIGFAIGVLMTQLLMPAHSF